MKLSGMHTLRLVVGTAAGALGVALAVVATASPAQADATYCGHQIQDINQGQDGIAALNELMTEGEDSEIQMIAQAVNQGPTICGPMKVAMQVGADVVVDGAVFGIFDVEVPLGPDITIAALKTDMENAENQPTVLPDVGPPVTGTVSWTGGIGLRIHSATGTDTPWYAVIPEGTQVTIACQTTGDEVDGPYGADSWWDQISYDGQTGYASDAYVDTGTNSQVAGSC